VTSTDQATMLASAGPDWAPHTLDVKGGRFPLSVEAHLMNMTAQLVPGATTVTTSARYYTLHGAVAVEAERRSLALPERLDLLRRCEVIMAVASIVHQAPGAGTVHGLEAIVARSDGTVFDLDKLATPVVGYSDSSAGFLGQYLGSEQVLGILSDGNLVPGAHIDEKALETGFDGLFELAHRDVVTAQELQGYRHLSIGAVASSADGDWLARQLCAVDLPDLLPSDRSRSGTIRLLAYAATNAPTNDLAASFRRLVAYGPHLRADPIVSTIPESEPWRGTLFRHDSVGAWRRLWAWLTDSIGGLSTRSELIAMFADALPAMSLGSFENELPPTVDVHGDPADAESIVRSDKHTLPAESLALILLGCRRSAELTGPSRSALVGNERKVVVLSPLWVESWVATRRPLQLKDVAAELTDVLLDRAQRIALSKMRMRNGRMWLPSVVGERGGHLYTVGREGRGNVGLRLDQLANILRGLGVLGETEGTWHIGTRGEELLGPSA
jgi:hypothetical protein